MPAVKSIVFRMWVVVILVAITHCAAIAARPTVKVVVNNAADKVVISAAADSPFNVGVFKSSAGAFVGFELRGVLMNSGKLVSIRSGRIHNIKCSSFKNNPPVSRIVVNTASSAQYNMEKSDNGKNLTITVWKNVNNGVKATKESVASETVFAPVVMAKSDKLPSLDEKVLSDTEEVGEKPAAKEVKVAKAAPAVKTVSAAKVAPVAKVVKSTPKPQPVAVAAVPKAKIKPRPVPVSSYTKREQRVSLNFSNADIVDVLKALALQSRHNIVVSKTVGGKITLNLNNVTPEQVLTYVTKMSGFSYVKQGDTYLVGTKTSLFGLATNDDLKIKVEAVILSYASPNDVISILQSRFPDLKIRKSDSRWRMITKEQTDQSDNSTMSLKNETGKGVGQAGDKKGNQSSSNQDNQDNKGQSGGQQSADQGKDNTKNGQSSGRSENNESQAAAEYETMTMTEEVVGRYEQAMNDSDMLILSGQAATIEQAKKMIAEVEKSVYTSTLENTFEVFRLRYVKADELASAVRQLVPGVAVRRAPQPSALSGDEKGQKEDVILSSDRAIIISGRKKDVEKAMGIAVKLDGSEANSSDGLDIEKSKLAVELAPVRNVSGDDAEQALKAAFPALRIMVIKTNSENKPEDNKISAITDSVSTSQKGTVLQLIGPADIVAEAKEFINQMDNSLQNPLMVGGKEQTVKMEKYEIKYVNAVELASTLRTLVPSVTTSFAPSEGFSLQAPGAISLAEGGATIAKAASEAPKQDIVEGKEVIPQNPRYLLLLGPDSDVKKAMELASSLDIKSPQIKLTAKITSITESGEKKLGLNWGWDSYEAGWDKKNDVGGNGNRASWAQSAFSFNSTLDALSQSGDIQILATPSLTMLEGKPGVFFVGDEITYITRVETTATGQNVQTEKALVGIQLKAVGDISPDGNVTLNLHPEVSTLKLETNTVANVQLPIISRRFTDQVIRVKNGETYVVGGLIRTDEEKEFNKIPILGDIPFFGSIFQHSAKTKQKTEIVMFITATVVED